MLQSRKLTELCTENIAAVLFFIFLIVFPFTHSAYQIGNFANFYVTVILAMSLVLIWGYTGIFSFGQAAFYGIGGYAYAILAKASGITMLSAVIAILIATLVAAAIGYFIFYGGISDIFTGIITMCISSALETFMNQTSGSQWKILGVELGGYNGLNYVPHLSIGSFEIKAIAYYVLMVAMIAVVYLTLRKVASTKWGYAMFGVRESKTRSAMFGYDTRFIQTLVFALSGTIAGLAGVLFASGQGYVVPSTMSMATSTTVIVTVAAAGKKNATGGMILTLLYAYFSQYLAARGTQYTNIILGTILIIVVLFVPEGILNTLFRKTDELVRRLYTKRKSKEQQIG